MRFAATVLLTTVLGFNFSIAAVASESATGKPSPDEVVQMLKEGNERFQSGQSMHPHMDAERLRQAVEEGQGKHAVATVIACSDSRVPVELLFDAGVMDLFVIRVAGNVCNTDEIGSIEYGLAHVHTPVLVVLGHTSCGAVTAVTEAVEGHGHPLERNIPPLVASIQPAVKKAQEEHPHTHGDELVPFAVEENVWESIRNLLKESPAVREMVESGDAKIVGAIYDIGTGEITWLGEGHVKNILDQVNDMPDKATEALAQ